MIVLIVERVPASLRGEVTRWLLETRPGVFVGHVSAMVRDKLWDKVCEDVAPRRAPSSRASASAGGSGAMLLYSADNEQGFVIRYYGETTRSVVDFEGLTLIKVRDQVTQA